MLEGSKKHSLECTSFFYIVCSSLQPCNFPKSNHYKPVINLNDDSVDTSTAVIKQLYSFALILDAEGYTSIYGDGESDNQYEEIQGDSKCDGLRSIKELLLRVIKSFYFHHKIISSHGDIQKVITF